ncbi:MAG: DNA gyrase inhibitor YacG [Pirellulaceae bacterium]
MSTEPPFRPRCPTCDILVDPVQGHRSLPFCSERCRLRDLGRWLNEEHALPCEDVEDDVATEQTSSGPVLPPGWHDA